MEILGGIEPRDQEAMALDKGLGRKYLSTFDKVQPFWHDLFTVLHDEDTSHVQFDGVLLFLVLEQIEGSSLGNKEDGSEFQLSLNREMFDS